MVLSVGYHKKGYPKQEPKMSLKPCKNQSQKTTVRSLQNSPIRSRPCAEASYERPKAPHRGPLAKTLSPRPRPERSRMGCQFSDSLEAGLDKRTRNRRPDQTPLTKRHVQIKCAQLLLQTSAALRYSTGRTTNGTRDQAQQGLPATVLITVLPNPCAKDKAAWKVKSMSL